MKKFTAVFLAVCVLLACTACAGAGSGSFVTPDSAEVPEEAAEALAEAVEDVLGVTYAPIALLGTRSGMGKDYCLLCESTVKDETVSARPYYTVITVPVNLFGKAGDCVIVPIALSEISESGEVKASLADRQQIIGGWYIDRESPAGTEGGLLHLAKKTAGMDTERCILGTGARLIFLHETAGDAAETVRTVQLDLAALSEPD